jgi:3-phosphoshikimate 1-carboxyvinyltransferase
MSASVTMSRDGFSVSGPSKLHGADIETAGDHRIALAFAIAGLIANRKTVIQDANCVAVSYPEFWRDLECLAPGSAVLA